MIKQVEMWDIEIINDGRIYNDTISKIHIFLRSKGLNATVNGNNDVFIESFASIAQAVELETDILDIINEGRK